MLEPWNNKAILPPPMNTFLYKKKQDIRSLRHNIHNIILVLSKQSPLHQESAVFSRFLYKFDKKFRNDIGYRNFKKVNTALKKYLTLNLLKDVQRFSSILPNKDDEELYLPTRQMLQYVLVRIMSFAKLMIRIVICAKQAAVFYLDRIKRGESHWMCLMPYALLSRIWSLTQVLLQRSCNWYNQLYPTLELLQLKGLEFLPSEYKLPADLETWCDLKNLNEYSNFKWTNKIKIKMEPIMLEDSDVNLYDSIFEYVNEINKNLESSEEEKLPNNDLNTYRSDVGVPISRDIIKNSENKYLKGSDVGVPISRDIFKKSENKYLKGSDVGVPISRAVLKNSEGMSLVNKSQEKVEAIKKSNYTDTGVAVQSGKSNEIAYTHSIDNISNNNCLKKFLGLEEEYRNKNDNKTLTGHLSLMQWHTLKASLLKLTEDGCLPRKLQKRIKKIWNEKCLYYK